MSYDEAIRLYGNDKPDMRLPAMVNVREAFTPEDLEKFASAFKVGPDVAPVLIRIPKAGEMSGTERRTIGTYGAFAHAQGTSSVQLDDRPKSFRERLSGLAGTNPQGCGSRTRRFVAACCRAKQIRNRAPFSFFRLADNSGSILRKNTRQNMEHLQKPAIPPEISVFFGSLTSPCSSGTERASAGTQRIILSHRCTTKTWPSSRPVSIRSTIPSLRWAKSVRWLMTWC